MGQAGRVRRRRRRPRLRLRVSAVMMASAPCHVDRRHWGYIDTATCFSLCNLPGTSSTWTAGTGPASTMPRERRLGTRWVHARCCRCRRHSWSTGRRCGPFGEYSAIVRLFLATIHYSFGAGLPGRAGGARRVRRPPQRLKKCGNPAAAHRAADGQVCCCSGVTVVRWCRDHVGAGMVALF